MENDVTINLGPPLFLTFLTFMILKLCKVITWSWVWVTAPLWIPFGFVIGFIVIVFIFGLIAAALDVL